MTVPQNNSRRKSQRGMVLMTMAVCAIAMIGAMGLAIDLGHIFIVKNETQAYVDAAAIAAALQIDGTTAGITRANTAATNLSAHWNFDSAALSSPTVEFSSASSGATWYAPGSVTSALAPTMLYTRVTKTVAPNVYFIPVVMTNPIYTQNVQSQAIAGQVDFSANTSIPAGLGPFAGVAACSGTVSACEGSAPNFGLTVGNEYDLQWPQYNGNRGNCKHGTITDCFGNNQPCSGDVSLNTNGGAGNPMQEVVQNWGPSTNGYWGSNSTSQINKYILDTEQLSALTIGTDITPYLASGNKQGTAKVLDDRVNEDTINYDPSSASTPALQLSSYLANSSHNGRRLMGVPMVYPNATGTQVVGYAMFLLESNVSGAGGSSSYYAAGQGNDPYCAIYAGSWVVGATNGGVGSTSGGGRVRLVQ
jgi:Flp pilus assembly protein TadG